MNHSSTLLAHTTDVSRTKCIAASLAPCLKAGDVVLLVGDLGAGKTQFVQGVAARLGITAPVTSPTFSLMLMYDGGTLPLYHFDLYRLEDPADLDDIGYWETIEGDGVCLVEWGDRFADALPDDYLTVSIECTTETDRTIFAEAHGTRAASLLAQWQDAVGDHPHG